MKKIFKTFIFACTVALLSVSCDSDENLHSYTGPLHTYFNSSTYSVNAIDNDNNTVTIVVLATTASSNDRQITLSVDPASTAVLGVDFNVANTVTIPANSYRGSVVLTSLFTENTLAGAKAILDITDPTVAQFKNKTVVNLKHRSCLDIGTLFTGTYTLEHVAGDNGFAATNGEPFRASVVTLVDNGTNSRTFDVPYLLPTAIATFELSFDCSYITIQDTNTGVGCGDTIMAINPPAGSEGTYLPTDDSEFYFTFMEEIDPTCPVAYSTMTTYKLTKN